MTKNPFLNALAALAYIALVASFMFYGPQFAGHKEDTIFIPIAMLSLFVLSAAVMGYIFLSQPLLMYFDGQKKESVALFLQTVAVFACGTLLLLCAVFLLPASPQQAEQTTGVASSSRS